MSQIKNYQTSKLYQFTAIDTFSRLRILEGYLEQSTYTAWLFLVQVLSFYKTHVIEVKMVQTDNGPIFTNRFLTTNQDKLTDIGSFKQRLKAHQKRSNSRGMRPLFYLSPLEFLQIYFWLHGR